MRIDQQRLPAQLRPSEQTRSDDSAVRASVFDDELVNVKEITSVLKIGPTKWWEGVRSGLYPQPIKLGNRCTRWSRNSIAQLMERGVKR